MHRTVNSPSISTLRPGTLVFIKSWQMFVILVDVQCLNILGDATQDPTEPLNLIYKIEYLMAATGELGISHVVASTFLARNEWVSQ